MQLPRRHFFRLLAGATAFPAASRLGWAQTYPSRPITMVIPYPPGGATDVVARILGQGMHASLGQPVIIENRGGANGSIGVGHVAHAVADGYTLVVGNWNTFVANGALYSLPYDLKNDFLPIALLSYAPVLITARKTMPANDLQQFISWLKANPDKAIDGHAGIGSIGHVVGIFFQKETGTRFQLIPYSGGGRAVQDLVAGHIDFIMNTATDTLAQVRAGTVKAYAVTAKSRLSALPDIPTVDESGLPNFYFSQWFGLWAPKATPDHIIGKINNAVVKALVDPVVRHQLADSGEETFPPAQQTSEALGALHRAEIEKWWPIIQAAGIKAE